jgi:hypothetical protein
LQPGGAPFDSHSRYEMVFTALVAVFLIVAAEGRHA